MNCKNCGSMIDDDALFCAECGTHVEKGDSQFTAVCPNYGNKMDNDAEFCDNCGKNVDKNEPVNALLCPDCKSAVDDDAEFCGNCGFRLAQNEPPASVVCPNCGALIQSNTEFCNNCGAMTAAFSLTPPIPPQSQPMQQPVYRQPVQQPGVAPGFAAHVRAEEERKKKNRRTFWIVFSSVLGGIILIVLLILLLSRCSMDYTPSYLPDDNSGSVNDDGGGNNGGSNNGGEVIIPGGDEEYCPCGGDRQENVLEYLAGTVWIDSGRRVPYGGDPANKHEKYHEWVENDYYPYVFEFPQDTSLMQAYEYDMETVPDMPQFYFAWGVDLRLSEDGTIIYHIYDGKVTGIMFVCDGELYYAWIEDDKYKTHYLIFEQIEEDVRPIEDFFGEWVMIGTKDGSIKNPLQPVQGSEDDYLILSKIPGGSDVTGLVEHGLLDANGYKTIIEEDSFGYGIGPQHLRGYKVMRFGGYLGFENNEPNGLTNDLIEYMMITSDGNLVAYRAYDRLYPHGLTEYSEIRVYEKVDDGTLDEPVDCSGDAATLIDDYYNANFQPPFWWETEKAYQDGDTFIVETLLTYHWTDGDGDEWERVIKYDFYIKSNNGSCYIDDVIVGWSTDTLISEAGPLVYEPPQDPCSGERSDDIMNDLLNTEWRQVIEYIPFNGDASFLPEGYPRDIIADPVWFTSTPGEAVFYMEGGTQTYSYWEGPNKLYVYVDLGYMDGHWASLRYHLCGGKLYAVIVLDGMIASNYVVFSEWDPIEF